LALTTVIVSFSCTGPIIGALLVKAASGDVLEPTVGMFGFGLGFALPFTILALAPGLMKKLPKSGGWLNSVKVVMGFIILAFSLKYFSNIDQSYNLGLMSRDFIWQFG
jgi:thiol:disulfide interchange protein DsbD